MKEVTVVIQGRDRVTYNVDDTATWGDIRSNNGLPDLEYRLRGNVINDSFVPVNYDTVVGTQSTKGGIQ